jgi:signal transduction histidine kinase
VRIDRFVAAALVPLALIEIYVGHAVPGPRPIAVPIALALAATVAVRRRAPLAAGVAAMVLITLQGFDGGHGTSVAEAIAWMCGLYAIAVWTDSRGFLIGAAALVVLNTVSLSVPPRHLRDTGLFTILPIVAMVLLRGAVRGRQLRAEALAARAELLERHASDAVLEERARIARELHDLVAHNVSVMVVQAGAERHALPGDQAETRETLASIEQSGRQALAEARRLLGVLRRDGEPDELEPQPGLEQLETLVAQVRRAGLSVALTVEGEPAPLPAGLDLCAYRIVQEGLTNALKHAGAGASAQVRIAYAPAALEIDVRDNGNGAVANGAGHGLIGMRERVALYGGELEAGPRAEGGFGVHARLPR